VELVEVEHKYHSTAAILEQARRAVNIQFVVSLRTPVIEAW
jgi:hypothetical protein